MTVTRCLENVFADLAQLECSATSALMAIGEYLKAVFPVTAARMELLVVVMSVTRYRLSYEYVVRDCWIDIPVIEWICRTLEHVAANLMLAVM